MREHISRLNDFSRRSAHRNINNEATLALGITAKDFCVGVFVLLAASMIPWLYAPFLALALAVVFVFLSTRYRNALPPRFFSHVVWAFGPIDWAPERPGLWRRALALVRFLKLQPAAPRFPSPFARAKSRFVRFLPQ
jgi:hypothetical protein